MSAPIDRLLPLLGKVKRDGDGWKARCPAHDDSDPSLSVSVGTDGRVLLHDFGGCTTEAIVTKLGITMADLFTENLLTAKPETVIKRETGQTCYSVRVGEREFSKVRIDYEVIDTDGVATAKKEIFWTPKPSTFGVKPEDFPLWGAGHLGDRPGETVIVAEGEKAADALTARGFLAVGTMTGSSTVPCDESLRVLLAHPVILWPDADSPGHKHMTEIGVHLGVLGHVNMRWVEWKNAPLAGDAADFTGTDAELADLLDAAVCFGEQETKTARETPAHSGRRTLSLTRASSIQMRPVQWAWEGRFPSGCLAIVAGREGNAKTTWCHGFTADMTRGRVPGAYFGTPKNVIIAATEDSWAHTIVPRLAAAGADLERVFRIDVTTSDGVAGSLTLPVDTEALEEVMGDGETGALLLDPLMSRLDASLDTHKDAEVRRALEPIAAMADRTGVLILGLIHLNKSTGSDPLTQVMGSRAFAAVPRAGLVFARDPEDESRILVGQPKNNLGRTDLPSLRYRIESVHVADTDEGPVWATKTVLEGESDTTISEALDVASGDRTATSDAAAWLEDFMESVGGVTESKTVKEAAKQAGHSSGALARARSKLHIAFEYHGFPRRSYWRSPLGSRPGESDLNGMNGTNGTNGDPVVPFVPFDPVVPDSPVSDPTGSTVACPGCQAQLPANRRPMGCYACGWEAS